MSELELGEVYHGQKAGARRFIELPEAVMRQDAVLPHHGHEVGRDTDNEIVQQRDQGLERYAETLGICLDEFEAHSATRKVVERIMAVLPLGIEHRDCWREL